MSGREKPRVRAVVPTVRGVVQTILGVTLLVVGLTCGLYALAAAGSALLLACVTGLLEVLLTRSRRGRGVPLARLLPTPERLGGTWVRLDQHGHELGRTRDLPGERGLYRQGPSTLLWRDAFGFWQAAGAKPSGWMRKLSPTAVRHAMPLKARKTLSRRRSCGRQRRRRWRKYALTRACRTKQRRCVLRTRWNASRQLAVYFRTILMCAANLSAAQATLPFAYR